VLEWDPAALQEVDEAAGYYEERRPGLAAELLGELKETLLVIEALPASFPRLRDIPEDLCIRRALLHRFPFAVIFVEMPAGGQRAIAFSHAKKRPGYWLWRVDP